MSLRDSLPAPWLVAVVAVAGLTAGVLWGKAHPGSGTSPSEPVAPAATPVSAAAGAPPSRPAPAFPGIPGAPPPEIAKEMESAIADAFGGNTSDPMQVRVREQGAVRLEGLVAKWKAASARDPLASAAWWKAALGRAVPLEDEAPPGVSRREIRFLDTTIPLLLSVPPRKDRAAGRVPLVLSVMEEPPPAEEALRALYGPLLGTHAVAAVVAGDPVFQDPRLALLGIVEAAKALPVDFDRVVLDGTGRGAGVAADLAPDAVRQFAGLLLRGGRDRSAPAGNLALLAVFDFAVRGMEPTASSAAEWIQSLPPRRVADPTQPFAWETVTGERYRSWGGWFLVKRYRGTGAGRPVRVSLSRDRERNAVLLHTENVSEIQLLLDDEGLDLDRPVKVVLDGMVIEERTVERRLETVRAWASQGEPTFFVSAEMTVRIPE